MTTFTIGEAAERTGFTASSLRYYERHGVLPPASRTDAGYRLYDLQSLERLRFIARAKELGCTLDEIADLAELWAADDCAPVQRRLHELVTAKLADAGRRNAELIEFTAQLRTAAAHLGADPVDGACGPACACLGGDASAPESESVSVTLGRRTDPEIVCTLPADDLPERIDAWSRVTSHVTGRQSLPDGGTGARLELGPDTPLDELIALTKAEQGCCSFFAFALTVDGRGIALEVRAPADAADVIVALFGGDG